MNWGWAVWAATLDGVVVHVSGWTLLHNHPVVFRALVITVLLSTTVVPLMIFIGLTLWRRGRIGGREFGIHFVGPAMIVVLGFLVAAMAERSRSGAGVTRSGLPVSEWCGLAGRSSACDSSGPV